MEPRYFKRMRGDDVADVSAEARGNIRIPVCERVLLK
jgi:hypothetical protein